LAFEKSILRQGNVVFESFNQSDTDLKVILGIPKVYHPESGSFYSEQKVAQNELFQKAFDISDYHLDFTGPNNDTVNMLSYQVDLIIHPDEPGTVMVKPEDSIALNVYFKDILLYYSRGYFGHETYPYGPEIYEFDMFEDIDVKEISFDEAEVWIEIKNTFGEEVNINVNDITAINTNTGEVISLGSELLNTDLFIDRAHEIEEESGNIEPKTSDFDFSESNFPEIFSIQPNRFSYELSVETNVYEDSTSLNNFFYYDQPIVLTIDAKVNGGLKIDSLFQESRIEWQGKDLDISNVEEGHLKLIFNNAFPFDFLMNIYLEDEDLIIIDTLVHQLFMRGGYMDENNFVSAPFVTKMTIPLDEDIKKHINTAVFARYELVLNSSNNEYINIKSTDYLQFKIIGDFDYLIEQ